MTTELESRRIGFVGAGRVAQTLSKAFAHAGLQVSAAWSRDAADTEALCTEVPGCEPLGGAQEVVDDCDLIVLAVSDDAIAAVADGIRWKSRHWVVHCSGATEVTALSTAARAGARTGGFHPMQMFANPAVALAGLPGCTIGIEAHPALQCHLEALAVRIGCVPFRLPGASRALYHASAYYVGPFLIALLKEACLQWQRFGATEKEALHALLPLLRGTVSAVLDGGLAQGMGGCVARGDVGTVRTHLKALEAFSPGAAELYRQLAIRTIPLGVERGTLSPSGAGTMRAVLGQPSGDMPGNVACVHVPPTTQQ